MTVESLVDFNGSIKTLENWVDSDASPMLGVEARTGIKAALKSGYRYASWIARVGNIS